MSEQKALSLFSSRSSALPSSPHRISAAVASSSNPASVHIFDLTKDDSPLQAQPGPTTSTSTTRRCSPSIPHTPAPPAFTTSTSRQLSLDHSLPPTFPPSSSMPATSFPGRLPSLFAASPTKRPVPRPSSLPPAPAPLSPSNLVTQLDDDDDAPLSSRPAPRPRLPRMPEEKKEQEKPAKPSKPSPPPPTHSPAPRARKRKSASAPAAASADPSVVLRHVREAVDAMRRDLQLSVPTLASLNLPGVKGEVLMMEEDAVKLQVEKLVLYITASILDGDGFGFDIPVRHSSNQLFVPEINRIVLKDRVSRREFASFKHSKKAAITTRILQLVYELCTKRIHVTKRDLFYTDVKLFTKQTETDDVLDDCAAMIGCTRTSLNVVASEKGIVVGQVSFYDDGDFIDATKMGVGGKAIPPYIERITGIQGKAEFILLVEKDAAFMRLAEDRFYNTFPCIIITAKGQPDVATRLFLKKLKVQPPHTLSPPTRSASPLSLHFHPPAPFPCPPVQETLRIPIFGLVDSDPYGLKILSVYLSGSKNMSYDSASLTTADVQWLGVRPSDLDRYAIPAQCRLDMSQHDVDTGEQMLKEEFIQRNPSWLAELELMVQRREKAEIQALSSFGFQYLTHTFLPQKLQDMRPDLPDPFMPDPPPVHSAAARALRRAGGMEESWPRA